MKHQDYMGIALELARQAAANGEVPVGALIVRNENILCQNYNRRETDRSATAHAEILVIEEACRKLNRWRLDDCTLYVTLEPCPMCAGAIVLARLRQVVFGCDDSRWGAVGSLFNIPEHPNAAFHPQIVAGIRAAECKELLQNFFQKRRAK